MWATTTTAVGIVGFQRFQGTLEFLAVSTLAPGTVFASLASAAALIGWVGIPIGIVLQIVISGGVSMHAAQFLALFASTTACIASACVLAALFVLTRSANAFEPLILVPVWLLSGVVIPLVALPQWLWPVALLHPLTSAVEAGRQADLSAGVFWVAISLGVSIAWLLLAKVALGAALRRARVAGTLALS